MRNALVFAMLVTPTTTPVVAQQCSEYVGKVVEPTNISAAIQEAKSLPLAKDEFETTADFQNRLTKRLDELPDSFNLLAMKFDDQIKYNADEEVFRISPFAFSNKTTWLEKGFTTYEHGPKPQLNLLDAGVTGNVMVVLSSNEKVVDNFTGTNAFGVSAEVKVVNQVDRIVFDRRLKNWMGAGDDLFGVEYGNEALNIPANIETAKQLKSGLKGVFVAIPKAPYYREGAYSLDATIHNQQQTNVVMEVLIADIQCLLILDSENIVIAARPTK